MPAEAAMLGRFLEWSLPTADIAASVHFYERLGLTLLTGEGWPYRYGVVTDGRLYIGLHAERLACPTLSFVLTDLRSRRERLEQAGLAIERCELGEEALHHLELRDPGGNAVRLLEARTFSPAGLPAGAGSLMIVLPVHEAEASAAFWDRAGLIAMPEEAAPLAHRPLVGDGANLALDLTGARAARLVWHCPDPAPLADLPGARREGRYVHVRTPEGVTLLAAPADN